MSGIRSLTFFGLRHPDPNDPPTVTLRLHLASGFASDLLGIGGRQSSLSVILTETDATLDLSGLDNLLEASFIGCRMSIAASGFSWDRNIVADVENLSGGLPLPDLSLASGFDGSGGPLVIMRYGIRADFRIADPHTSMETDSPTGDAASEDNDLVLLFPNTTNARENRLWASSETLRRASPYFARLLASPFCSSYGELEDPDGSTGTWTKPITELLRTYTATHGQLKSDVRDSDDEEFTALLSPGFSRKPRNLVNLPFSQQAGSDTPLRWVIVKHAQFRTYRAILYFLKTHTISFSCLLSGRATTRRGRMENGHLAASPKSLLRLASMLGIDRVAEMAKKDLISQLGSHNLVTEMCSDATARCEALKRALEEAIEAESSKVVHAE